MIFPKRVYELKSKNSKKNLPKQFSEEFVLHSKTIINYMVWTKLGVDTLVSRKVLFQVIQKKKKIHQNPSPADDII